MNGKNWLHINQPQNSMYLMIAESSKCIYLHKSDQITRAQRSLEDEGWHNGSLWIELTDYQAKEILWSWAELGPLSFGQETELLRFPEEIQDKIITYIQNPQQA